MNLQELQNQIHEIAKDHGWHDDTIRDAAGNPTVTQFIAWMGLVHSEIVEADTEVAHYYHKDGKPEGKIVELADVKIRLLDVAGALKFETMENQCFFINHENSLHSQVADMTESARVNGISDAHLIPLLYGTVLEVEHVAKSFGYDAEMFERIVLEKCEYNRNREYKHGKLA
jgi:hypothetical protein